MGEPLVTVAQGTVRGFIDVDHDGKSYYSFRGIPYAKPPVGELRFKAPVAAEKWDGVFDATKEGDACYARDMFTMEFGGTENCLILNVFTKSLMMSTSTPKPVMVWIHGGGLLYGSSSTTVYSPAFLMTKDVVVVSINYRLGMLGFLSFKDRSAGVPGNAGMKDMVMALRWVQQNIAQFGGDPMNVTIFGESAGGASVHLLMLSPMAKGLFHKAIAQSGCGGLNFWATSDGCCVEKLAEAAGRPGSDAKKLLQHLRSLSVEDVLRIQEKLTKNFLPSNVRPFVVVIEETLNETDHNEPAFLAEQPIDILSQGNYNQVPFMTGFTTGEGMCFEYLSNIIYDHLDSDFEYNIPHNLGYKMGEIDMKNLVTKVKKYYFGDETPSRQNIDNYFDLLADVTFIYGQAIGIEKLLVKSKCPIYLYRMSVETGLNFLKLVGKLTGKGAAHCDDLGYLFKNFATPNMVPGSPEEIGMRRFVKLWTNFATYGNPTPDAADSLLNNVSWKPVQNKNEMHFLEIGMELKTGVNPYRERIEFWREIHANSPLAYKIA